MYKLELKIDGKFVNNFYNGSIYDLVFLDLEFWPDYDYIEGKTVQRIYGYTLTRLIKSNKKQYIKIKFLEFKTEEEQLIKDIIQDIDALNNKVLIGFNIKDSDLLTLRNRLKMMSIYTDVKSVNIFDFRKYSKSHEYRGLNGLFEHLSIKVNKKIDGSYFHKNTKKVFSRKSSWKDILLNMFEYCLEDAAGYFEIVSNWNQQFPKITKDMVTSELLNYSAIEKEASFKSINQEAEIFSMENFQASPEQLLSILTVADLEALIVKIVQKTLKEEMQKLKHDHLPDQTTGAMRFC
jgi:DNA polymerase elongation subunit (family B)